MNAVCASHGGYADWECELDAGHEDAHRDALDRTWPNEGEDVPPVPVIAAEKITVSDAERALDRGYDGEMEIEGVKVAFYVDPFDKEFVWFHNPGEDPGDEGELAIARFEVERTVVRA
ncbi:hypothetical protein [Agromyces aureus]|uniref:Uncharacterized protein n=1 Tax=Agromyces aureus TaxID=453304 RepID=A0A191WF17_9MICO|nr:hypothetical protein [Agromyces aureus]ANJ26783.1 hypothetical protein ATC03_08720 [Agromyces aureus]